MPLSATLVDLPLTRAFSAGQQVPARYRGDRFHHKTAELLVAGSSASIFPVLRLRKPKKPIKLLSPHLYPTTSSPLALEVREPRRGKLGRPAALSAEPAGRLDVTAYEGERGRALRDGAAPGRGPHRGRAGRRECARAYADDCAWSRAACLDGRGQGVDACARAGARAGGWVLKNACPPSQVARSFGESPWGSDRTARHRCALTSVKDALLSNLP